MHRSQSESPPTEGDYIALVAMLRQIQCEPASFDTYSMASVAERAADAIERLRSSGGATAEPNVSGDAKPTFEGVENPTPAYPSGRKQDVASPPGKPAGSHWLDSSERRLLDRAINIMSALHADCEPIPGDPELTCKVSPAAFRKFVDALAKLHYECHHLPQSSGEPAAQQWQPIETAPRDGTHILVANLRDRPGFGRTRAGIEQPWTTVAHYWNNSANPDEAGFYPSVEQYDREIPLEKGAGITHWKPLDGFPSTKGDSHG